MKDLITLLTKEIKTEEGGKIEYELAQISVNGKICFITSVSDGNDTGACVLDGCDESLSHKLFGLIVKSETTPLILMDTVYDILH